MASPPTPGAGASRFASGLALARRGSVLVPGGRRRRTGFSLLARPPTPGRGGLYTSGALRSRRVATGAAFMSSICRRRITPRSPGPSPGRSAPAGGWAVGVPRVERPMARRTPAAKGTAPLWRETPLRADDRDGARATSSGARVRGCRERARARWAGRRGGRRALRGPSPRLVRRCDDAARANPRRGCPPAPTMIRGGADGAAATLAASSRRLRRGFEHWRPLKKRRASYDGVKKAPTSAGAGGVSDPRLAARAAIEGDPRANPC